MNLCIGNKQCQRLHAFEIHHLIIHSLRFVHFFVSFHQFGQTIFIQGTNWFGKISIELWVVQVNYIGLIIAYDPRENWILCQILKGSISQTKNGARKRRHFCELSDDI